MNARLNTKDLPRFLTLLLLALGGIVSGPTASAQGTTNLFINAFGPSNAIPVNSSLTYRIFVTNTATVTINDVFVTNTLPLSVQILSASNDHSGQIFTNATTVTLQTFQLIGLGDVASMTLTVRPLVSGLITNAITLFGNNVQSNFTGLIVTQVTNRPAPETDLAVFITGPVQAVITNDYMIYGVTVSNLGPNQASNVLLTNRLAGMKFITNSPVNFSRTFNSSNVNFNLGTLKSNASVNLSLTLQPTNAGPLTLFASIGSASITDLNPTNDTASLGIMVTNYLPGQLIATNISAAQTFDPQTGLMEQSVRLTNLGTNAVASARVVVSGLTKTNALFNTIGTNNGDPFVVYAGNLDPNQSIDLVMQYFVPTGLPFAMSTNQLNAFAIPAFNLTPPAPAGTLVSGVRIIQMPPGSVLAGGMFIDFPSTPNRTYTIVYSDNMFSNSFAAQPPVRAFANFTEWIDYGPPTTVSHPATAPMRFYRVLLNP